MPYPTTDALPANLRDVLPEHAREIYRAAYNSAWDKYTDPGTRRGEETREEVAHKVAWSAVERQYEKNDASGQWQRKSGA